jgi:hypothetical protein
MQYVVDINKEHSVVFEPTWLDSLADKHIWVAMVWRITELR